MVFLRTSAVLAFLLLNQVHAFNHPELEWKTVSTRHFTINYYDKTEPAVYAAMNIAEEVYSTLAPLYNYNSSEKMALSLAEYDDYSNGFAEWLSANIEVWIPDSRFDLRSNTTWLRNVITHEMAHIMSLEPIRDFQLVDIGIGLQVETPREQYGFNNPILMLSEYPTWLGIYKSYLFFGTLHFSLSHSLLRKSTTLSLTAGL